jgi:hypothetical protein
VTAARLILLVGFLLLAGLIWSLSMLVPSLYPASTVPLREGELWELNPR